MAITDFRCGYITILGRPNVGKSTLLNRLLGEKISITSRKPQTTRWQLLGISSKPGCQAIYIDTPGIQSEYNSPVHRHMTREALTSLENVDIVIFMIEALKWSEADEIIFQMAKKAGRPVIVVINKIDRIKSRVELLPFINKISATTGSIEIIPVSAKKGDNINRLEQAILPLLPFAPALFPDDQISDRNEKFFAAEFIREKLIQNLGDELPYRMTVTIESFLEEENLISISALIWVESKGQKNIVIGKNGEVLKRVGEAARMDMEKLFQRKVFLTTWVRVKKNWSTNEKSLQQFGFNV